MSLKAAHLLPHSPLLIPEIGKANHSFFEKTTQAYQKVAEELKQKEIEVLIILSPHASSDKKSFQINVSPEMEINLKDFGFIPSKASFQGEAVIADKIKESLEADFPIFLSSEATMDYGSAIPSYLLKGLGLNPKIIIISPASDLDKEEQLNFGLSLRRVIDNQDKKIAVLASGDLSHRLEKKSPGGYSAKANKFDNKIIEILSEEEETTEEILNLDEKLTAETAECALSPIITLLGVLNKNQFSSDILAYQREFGIGYLSVSFKIKDLKI